MIEDERLSFLASILDYDKGTKREFTSELKSAVFLREAIDSAVRCSICRARVHIRSITIDHITRRSEGGFGGEDNAQLAHPYCNTGYKN